MGTITEQPHGSREDCESGWGRLPAVGNAVGLGLG